MNATIDNELGELGVLCALERVLTQEHEALRTLDYARVQALSDEKIELDEQLRGLERNRARLDAETRATLRKRYATVFELAQRNDRRAQVSLQVVRGLVATLTGTDRSGYGPGGASRADGPQAVLTDQLG